MNVDRDLLTHWPEPEQAWLTDTEQDLLSILASVATLFREIIGEGGPTAESDWREIAAHIHDLQGAVMAQAAARAYPTRLRCLGSTIAPSGVQVEQGDER